MTAEIRNWEETKRRLQLRWPGLPEDELDASQGDQEAIVALLQGRLGYARSNAEEDVAEIIGGETIVPEDVADATTHTGTSGPVGPVSDATDFTGGATRAAANGERAELPNQPPETISASSTGPASRSEALAEGVVPEGMSGAGGPPIGNDQDRWGRPDPWESMHHDSGGGGMRSMLPKIVIGIAVAAGAVMVLGMIGRGRKHRRSKTEQVADQARHLLDDISERMPSVEEFREKVRSLDELRSKKDMRKSRMAAMAHR
jgi:hypothetical protein